MKKMSHSAHGRSAIDIVAPRIKIFLYGPARHCLCQSALRPIESGANKTVRRNISLCHLDNKQQIYLKLGKRLLSQRERQFESRHLSHNLWSCAISPTVDDSANAFAKSISKWPRAPLVLMFHQRIRVGDGQRGAISMKTMGQRYKSSFRNSHESADCENTVSRNKEAHSSKTTAKSATSINITNKHIINRLPNITQIHRPTKEELLAAATGFWSRLKVRFKWFSIRSARPFNIDEIGAFFSWVLVGHVLWIILGTTTFFSLAIFAVNTVFAQGTIILFPLATLYLLVLRDLSPLGWQLSNKVFWGQSCFRVGHCA